MCGRFTLRTPLTVLAQQFLFDLGTAGISPAEFLPRYNVAPTQTITGVRRLPGGPRRELAFLHWGLVPSWAKDTKRAASAINARAETLAEKPMFRTAFARRRCLVLADGYFEWKAVGKKKQPYYLRMKDERPFAFAGLWKAGAARRARRNRRWNLAPSSPRQATPSQPTSTTACRSFSHRTTTMRG